MIPTGCKEERRIPGGSRRGDGTAFSRLYRAFAQPLRAGRAPDPRRPPSGGGRIGRGVPDDGGEAGSDAQDRGGSIWSWLATVAANKARDVERERARRGHALRGFALLSAPLLDAQAPGPGDDAQAANDSARLQAAVARVMDELNPRYRRALTLRFLEDGRAPNAPSCWRSRSRRSTSCCCAPCARFASAGRRPSQPTRPRRLASR